MKTTILLFILAIVVPPAIGGEAYYYCRGQKIGLVESPDRMSVAVPASQAQAARSQSGIPGYGVARELQDERFHMTVYETPDSTQTATMRMALKDAMPSENVILLPCYKSTTGDELASTPYLDVKLKKEEDINLLQNEAAKFNLEITGQNEFMPLWYSLTITPQTGMSSLDVANRLYETGLFAEAIADLSSANDADISYDPLNVNQWGLYNPYFEGVDISVSKAWGYATGREVKIGILDTGVKADHIDLADNMDPLSYDTETGTSPAKLYEPHGTWCAGVAAAVRNNGVGITGVAPDATIVSISNTLKSPESQEKRGNGINWAWKNGVDIISCSWHSSMSHPIIYEAIDSAFKYGRDGRGCIIVFSVGNREPAEEVVYPANCNDTILAVGAVDSIGSWKQYSCIGDRLDVVAPGSYILTTDTCGNDSYSYQDGTSLACPLVAGIAALILERNPYLTVTQVNDIIEKSTVKVGDMPYNENRENGTWNSHYGYGMVNAYKALMNTPRPNILIKP